MCNILVSVGVCSAIYEIFTAYKKRHDSLTEFGVDKELLQYGKDLDCQSHLVRLSLTYIEFRNQIDISKCHHFIKWGFLYDLDPYYEYRNMVVGFKTKQDLELYQIWLKRIRQTEMQFPRKVKGFESSVDGQSLRDKIKKDPIYISDPSRFEDDEPMDAQYLLKLIEDLPQSDDTLKEFNEYILSHSPENDEPMIDSQCLLKLIENAPQDSKVLEEIVEYITYHPVEYSEEGLKWIESILM